MEEIKKMTIRDLMDQVELNGDIEVKQWDEDKETYILLSDAFENVEERYKDRKIQYMYSANNRLVIEVYAKN
jgi:DNA polymerase II large subunit